MAFDGGDSARNIVRRIMDDQSSMEGERANWENLYRQVAERVFPRADFFTEKSQGGELRTERIFDATAALALERFAAALQSTLTPRASTWHTLKARDMDIADDAEVKAYLEEVNRRLFAARYAPSAGFSSQMFEIYMSLGAFGTGAMMVDEVMGEGLAYRAFHLSEIYIGQNYQGRVDRVHRKFTLKAYQAAQMFEKDTLPEKVRNSLNANRPMDEHDFIHCVKPNEEYDTRRMDAGGMAWISWYVPCGGEMSFVVEKGKRGPGGYRTMPYAVSRYVTGPRETYGRSPAMTVLADIKMLNEMSKTMIRRAQRDADPPILLPEDGGLQPFSFRPGALNYGALAMDGTALAQALPPSGQPSIALELIQDRRKTINDAFLISLFQILVDNPGMTATEALLRAQEKGQLLGPALDRQQSELLGPMIERELDIMSMAGEFDDLEMPDALMETGGGIDVVYESPMNRLQRTDEAVGIVRTLETITPLAQIDPSVLDIIDPEEAFRILADANGVPTKALRTKETLAAMKEQRAQAQQAQAIIQALPQAASAAKDAAQAQAVSANSPPTIPFVQPR